MNCSDFERSLHFYHDLLDLEIDLDIQIPVETATGACLAPTGFRQVRLKAGNTLIKLMETDSPPVERTSNFQAGVRWLNFIIEDVPKTVMALKAKGVETIPISMVGCFKVNMGRMLLESSPDLPHLPCHPLGIELLGIERSRPVQAVLMLLMVRVRERIQKLSVGPDSTHISGWAGPFASDAVPSASPYKPANPSVAGLTFCGSAPGDVLQPECVLPVDDDVLASIPARYLRHIA